MNKRSMQVLITAVGCSVQQLRRNHARDNPSIVSSVQQLHLVLSLNVVV